MADKPNNSRFVDMGGGYIAEFIADQEQLFYNPTTQKARVIFNGAPYILMGDQYQRIGTTTDRLEQDLSNLMQMCLVPQGYLDPVTGADLSKISLMGILVYNKVAYDFFHNVRAGTPGYPLKATLEGPPPTP